MIPQAVQIIADDRTGFPLIILPGIPFQVGWFPLTWVQLEYFLSETSNRRFDSIWYRNMIQRMERVSATAVNASNFHTLFVRGLMLQESLSIGRWWGEDRYILPTAQEWQRVQQATLALPAQPNVFDSSLTPSLNPRAIHVAQAVERVIGGERPDRALGEQMLLQNGLRELVALEATSNEVGGIGKPHRTIEPISRMPILPLENGNFARRPEVGLRLFLKT